jgi:hypothetical protein
MIGLLGACEEVGFYNCAQEGYHYLDATGTTATISVAALYSGLPGFQQLFQYWLSDNISKAVQSLQSTPTDGSAAYAWDTSGSRQNRSWTEFDTTDHTNDWHWTLGRFSVRMVGDVWIGPANQSGDRPVQIRYRSFMWDIYDFTPGQKFGNLEDLAKVGMAADFVETGESSIEVINTTLKALNPNSLVAQGS